MLVLASALAGRGAAEDTHTDPAPPPADRAAPATAATPSPPVPATAPPVEAPPAPDVNPPKPPAPPSQPAPKPPEHLESTQSILGTQVSGEDGTSIGRLVDVFVDKAGVPREALLDIGGFLGVGSRRIVVPWQTLHFKPDSKDQTIAISMTSDQLKAAPEYKGAHPPPATPPTTPAQPAPLVAPGSASGADLAPAHVAIPACDPPADAGIPSASGRSRWQPWSVQRISPPTPTPDSKPSAPSQ